jgi:hypothetical protein
MMVSDRKMRMTTPGNGTGSSYHIQVTIRAFKFSNTTYPSSPHLPAGYSSFEQGATKRAWEGLVAVLFAMQCLCC